MMDRDVGIKKITSEALRETRKVSEHLASKTCEFRAKSCKMDRVLGWCVLFATRNAGTLLDYPPGDWRISYFFSLLKTVGFCESIYLLEVYWDTICKVLLILLPSLHNFLSI